ncbi:related to monooxigenase [Fusarium oxysporum]|uniref:Related to monooxigenase n=1 Tax=Fusarium oxysporum TaxID=5507 RepID=A0A2H3SYP8_FUSOX|nr:related to monooxigenase [Fusarium oxysporum]
MTATLPLRRAAEAEANGAHNGSATQQSPNWVPILEQPVFKKRKLRVVCVGAGYAGLMMAYKWKYQMKVDDFVDLVIYEKNNDIGGTWLVNRYPGVACDIPAHIYTFSFEPNPNWSSFFASGPEIWEYMKKTTEKYHLDERVQFNSRVTSTIWDDADGKWKLEINQNGNTIQDEADVLINGSGILHKWSWPDFGGLDTFRGKKIHSAAWDASVDWAGKRVAIIGNGSSAIQILPQMQPKAAKIVNYIRTPTWISANYASQLIPDGKNFNYTEEEKKEFRENPKKLLELQSLIEHHINKSFLALLVDTPEQLRAEAAFKKEMEKRLNYDAELCAKLIPEWKVGCRRLTPGEGYLEALQEPNVAIEFAAIEAATETGIKTMNGTEEFDIIVCATGFDVSFAPFWELVGKNGIRLADQWRDDPEAYFGICAPNMPNYFIFNGPNCPVGHGSVLAAMDATADYILTWCSKIATEDIKYAPITLVSIVAEVLTPELPLEFLKRTVWTSGCRSWYKSKKDGKVTAMYAGSSIHYKEILQSFRTEDFDFEYNSRNRFRFMGNGLTIREENGEHLGFPVDK